METTKKQTQTHEYLDQNHPLSLKEKLTNLWSL